MALTNYSWSVPIAGSAYEDASFPISVLCTDKKQALTVARIQPDIEDCEHDTVDSIITALRASEWIDEVLAGPDTPKKYAVIAHGYSPACIFVTWYVPAFDVMNTTDT